MARNLINQVPRFLFTLKSLKLRQTLNYSKIFEKQKFELYLLAEFCGGGKLPLILDTIQTRSLNKKQTNEGFS